MAQYASRASVGLHTQLFFKTRNLLEQGYVLTVRKNALQGELVFVKGLLLSGQHDHYQKQHDVD